MTPFARDLRAEIQARGGISVAEYMARCNAHYYATRDPFGAAGDFVTAPEISQMFGELIGAWMADLWDRAGRPRVHLVELGPGRGTLMADLLRAARAMPGFADVIRVHFVETSPKLCVMQAEHVANARWHDGIDTVPRDAPLLLVANEFFDALPVEQAVCVGDERRERMVEVVDGQLAFAPTGAAVRETSRARDAYSAAIGTRLAEQGGAALIVDYGYCDPPRNGEGDRWNGGGGAVRRGPPLHHASRGPPPLQGGPKGDTLQAVRAHTPVDPLAAPGEADLTAHVDFSALMHVAGDLPSRLTTQGAFLIALGIEARCERLQRGLDAEAAHAIASAMRRLIAPQAMGELFKVLALRSPDWPEPAGF